MQRRIMLWLAALASLLFFSAPVSAQENEIALEASFIRGALSYARTVRPGLRAGIELGFGFPQLDITMVPEQDSLGGPDFEEYLHVAAFLRIAPSDRVEIDVGARASIVDLYMCGASDCWPPPFLGVYAQPMVGWRRFKVGVRFTTGIVFETEPGAPDGSTGVLGMNPFILRYTLPW
jgi:hypothetical protein